MSEPAPAARSLAFGRFELRAQERRLLVDGSPADLGARAFDMLMALVERGGRLVSKDELLSVVWPGLVVEENNLQKQVSSLRKVLGADVIVTIPGRGYQFVAATGVAGAVAGNQPEGPAAAAAVPADPEPAAHAPRSNLPRWLPPLYGRAADVTQLTALVRAHRVVTVTGSGGIGKTRVAQAVAAELRDACADGAWMISLEALSDPALVPATIARALGVQLAADAAGARELARALAVHEMLVVLDNCEHLVAACAELVAALLALAPGVRILATSREPLRLVAEQVLRLPSLAVPGGGVPDLAHALGFGAVELFANRAREADARFALTEANLGQVIELCARLDGIALALELAAARVPLLGLDGVVSRLDQRLRILTGARRGHLPRRQTLAATFDWSYELLAPAEREVFDRLGVFAGSFALSSAQRVAAPDGSDEWAVLDHLGALVDKSLVLVDGLAAEPRYRLLETGREYTLQHLAASGIEAATRRRHAQEMLERIGRADRAILGGAPTLPTFLPLEADLNNLRAALHWASGAGGDAALAIELAARALWMWRVTGLSSEGAGWCAALIDRSGDVPAATAARFWLTVAMLDHSGRLEQDVPAFRRAVALYREVGDRIGLYWALIKASSALASHGEQAQGLALNEEAEHLATPDFPPLLRAHLENSRAIIENDLGRPDAARKHLDRFIALCRRGGDEYGELVGLLNLADIAYSVGATDEAVARGRELVGRARACGRESIVDSGFINFGAALADSGATAEAAQVFRDGLRLLAHNAASRFWTLDHLALLAAREGRIADAMRIVGHIDHGAAGKGRGPAEARSYARARALIEAALPEAERDRCGAEGARMSEDAIFALALPG